MIDEWGDEYTPPDIDTIRAALAVHDPANHDGTLHAYAPTWLAALCDEVGRLRERNTYLRHLNSTQAERLASWGELADAPEILDKHLHLRNAREFHLVAEVDRLTKELGYKVTLQRQLDKVDAELAWDGTGEGRISSVQKLKAERDEARRIADRLARDVSPGNSGWVSRSWKDTP